MNGTIETLETRMLLAVTGLPFRLGSDNFDAATRVAATPDGGYVVAGLFSKTIKVSTPAKGDFSLTARGDTDIFIAKYDSGSQLIWIRQIGGDDFEDGIFDQDEFIDIAGIPERGGGDFVNGFGPQPLNAAEYVTDLLIAPDGSIVLGGAFAGKVDFNPGSGKKIFTTERDDFFDGFVLKLQSGGGFLWARQIGEEFTEIVNGIAMDSTGAVYATGIFSRTIEFVTNDPDSIVEADGRADGFLMKLNGANGVLQWVNTFGSDATDEPDRDAGLDVAVDANDNVYMVGTFDGDEVDFDPSPKRTAFLFGQGDTDGFLAKYNSSGRFRYAASMGGEKLDGLNNVVVDSQLSVIVTGYFEDQEVDIEIGPGVTNRSATPEDPGDDPQFTDVFVEKLAQGKMQWVRQLAGGGTEFANDLRLDSNDNIVIAGAWFETAKFGSGPTLTSVLGDDEFDDINDNNRESSYDIFLWRLAPGNGATQFVRQVGGIQDDFGIGAGVMSDDSILLTGRFDLTVNFDTSGGTKNLNGKGLADVFVTGFDNGGEPLF